MPRVLLFIIRLCLWASLGLPFMVAAQDAIQERAYWADPSGQMTLAQAQAMRLTPYTGPLNQGYSPSAFWIRLKIVPMQMPSSENPLSLDAMSARYVLRIQPGYVDEVALYDPLDPQHSPRFVGDRHTSRKGDYRSLNHNFVIPAGEQPRYVWLRLKTSSTSLIHVEALPLAQAMGKDRWQDLVLGIFISALVFFFSWALLQWVTHRERLIGILAINQGIALLFALSILGYFRMALADDVPASWLDMSSSVLALVATASSIYFNIQFLREFNPSRFGLRLLLGMACLLPGELFLLLMSQVRIAMQINIAVVMLAPMICLLVALTGRVWEAPLEQPAPVVSKGGLVLFYGLVFAVLSLMVLPSLGVLASTELALQSNSVAGFFTGLILVVTLQIRARRMQKMHHSDLLSLKLAQQQVEQEKRQRLAQTQFMAMLTHELKTPLSVISMALGSTSNSPSIKARAVQAIQDMSGVIDRCAWVDRLEEKEFAFEKSEFDLVKELDRLTFMMDTQERVHRTTVLDTFPLLTDSRMAYTALSNLLGNALQYAAADTPIELRVFACEHEKQPGVSVSVANLPGQAGWPDPAQVFEKYYRAPGAHSQTGSGLGLYQASHVAQRLGGVLRYLPDQQFVRFELWLPT